MTEKKQTAPASGLLAERTAFKPFAYPWAYEAFMQSEQMHWLWTEVPMMEDVKDYRSKLTDDEREFLTKILRFFTQGDIDVSGAYVNVYLPRFRQPEIRMMLSSFAAREAVHIAAYSHLIETLGLPESIYNEFMEYEAMAAKHDFFREVEKDDRDLPAQIAAFSAFTEGMQLFSSFVMLLNFTRNGTMKGMGQIIAWSIADETLHTESMTKIFREYVDGRLEAQDLRNRRNHGDARRPLHRASLRRDRHEAPHEGRSARLHPLHRRPPPRGARPQGDLRLGRQSPSLGRRHARGLAHEFL
jgi:ribonucleoside-diphosphate reductase beta chain